jgi:hypothetical protein
MKHIILSRCNFVDDGLFRKYFEVMKNTFIPSVKKQICKNFKLFFNTNNEKYPHHQELIHQEFKESGIDVDTTLSDFGNYVIGNGYNIQTRHDCDDYMDPKYIQKIQEIYNENIEKYDEFLIHAQPTKLDFNTGEEYTTKTYPDNCTSMFLTLCQRTPNKHILHTYHGQFPKFVSKVISIETGYVKLVIHDNNKSSKISGIDKKI